MLRYEFFCHACERPFAKSLTSEEYTESRIVCPNCGSDEVEQRVAAFYPINRKEIA